jgi:RHS repeat-associated protein
VNLATDIVGSLPILFTSREFDAETGLYYNRARYFDPTTGRWTTEDPMGFAPGDPNLYRYVFNSSTMLVDPSGYWSWSGAWGGGLSGGGVGAGVGAATGSWVFGIGALPGGLIGGAVGFVGGFIVGGIWGEDATSWALNRPPEQLSALEVCIGGGVLGIPAGLVGGIIGPAGWSFATGALPSAPITFYFTAYGGTGLFWIKYTQWYRENFRGNPDPKWLYYWKIMQFFPPNTPTEGMFP